MHNNFNNSYFIYAPNAKLIANKLCCATKNKLGFKVGVKQGIRRNTRAKERKGIGLE
jgi:hypothetical protein